jgi:hypothetical protein
MVIGKTTEDNNTIYVDDDNTSGPWDGSQEHPFQYIQDGIDAASSGDTVYVYSGIYYENVVIEKTIDLIGEDKDSTILDGSTNTNNGITIKNSDYIAVSSFTIKNVPTHPSQPFWYSNGIHIWAIGSGGYHSNNNWISQCIIFNNSANGIRITAADVGQYADSNHIFDCEIHHNGIGSFSGVDKNGVYISADQDGGGPSFAKYNQVFFCKIYSNILSGVRLGHEGETSENTIFDCIIYDNLVDGIIIESVGLTSHHYYTHSNKIVECSIFGNCQYGINISSTDGETSDNNIIYHNNLENNSNNIFDDCTNIWYDSTKKQGNYYDEYTGTDSDGDGIGDTPYDIPGGSNQDLFPLMHPFGPPYAEFTYDNDTMKFNASLSGDYNGYIWSYEWDFGDGKTGYGKITSNKYCDIGTYDVTLTVTDDTGLKDSITKNIEVILPNIPPSIPKINGPKSGRPGIEYEYNFLITDPDGDDFYLWVDWGDGDNTNWIGPYSSDVQVKLSHSWNETGKYVIKAKLQDICYDEGAWGTLEVTMPRNRAMTNLLLMRFLEQFQILHRLLSLIRV